MNKFLAILIIVIVIILGGFFIYNSQKQPLSKYTSPIIKITQVPTSTQSLTQTPQPNINTSWVSTLSAVAISANQATIHTVKGNIVIQLYSTDAPKTVMNFATLAKYGYYNNLTFHRVVPGFVIQGGDPNGDGTGGVSIYGSTFDDELYATASSYQAGYLEGVVAMANRGPNTNGSQFFIMLADNPTLPKNYTIFGKVTNGMDVVQKIQIGDKMTSIDVK